MEDKLLLPKELTAENGAKGLLIGEFFEETEIMNHDYCGEDCDSCGEDEICPDDVENILFLKKSLSLGLQ